LETLHQRGLVHHLGLCNFDTTAIAEIIDIARVPPTLVQVAFNPFEKHDAVLSFCRERGIPVIGHSPLSPAGLLAHPYLRKLAANYGKAPAQIVLRWAVQRGVVPIPSSIEPDHIAANLAISDFQISDNEIRTIDSLDTESGIEGS
jgi:alcohol dehydrogenase (NADP+)